MPVRKDKVTHHGRRGVPQEPSEGKTYKYNFKTGEAFAKGMVNPDAIMDIYAQNKPLMGERLALKKILPEGAQLIGNMENLGAILSCLDFKGVNLKGVYLGGKYVAFLNDPRFEFDETTLFNDEEILPNGKTMHAIAMEIHTKRKAASVCTDRV